MDGRGAHLDERARSARRPPDIPGLDGEPLPAGETYIEVWLRSVYVRKLRVAHKRFFGSIHSRISLPQRAAGPGRHELVTVTTPSELRDKDLKNLENLVTGSVRLLGPVPHVGDDLEVDIALFAIKSSDLAAPFLDLLGEMSEAAGVSLVAQAKPFLGPLKRGLDLLAGGDRTLELAYRGQHKPVVAECRCVVRAPKGEFDVSGHRLADDWRLVDKQTGKPFRDAPYLVFTVQKCPTRPSWWDVCDLHAANEELNAHVEKGRIDEAKSALEAFRRRIMICPELLSTDKDQVYEEISRDVTKALSGAQKQSRGPGERAIRRLSELVLRR